MDLSRKIEVLEKNEQQSHPLSKEKDWNEKEGKKRKESKKEKKNEHMALSRIELETLCVLGTRDNQLHHRTILLDFLLFSCKELAIYTLFFLLCF